MDLSPWHKRPAKVPVRTRTTGRETKREREKAAIVGRKSSRTSSRPIRKSAQRTRRRARPFCRDDPRLRNGREIRVGSGTVPIVGRTGRRGGRQERWSQLPRRMTVTCQYGIALQRNFRFFVSTIVKSVRRPSSDVPFPSLRGFPQLLSPVNASRPSLRSA